MTETPQQPSAQVQAMMNMIVNLTGQCLDWQTRAIELQQELAAMKAEASPPDSPSAV